jgi:hypothetical protein
MNKIIRYLGEQPSIVLYSQLIPDDASRGQEIIGNKKSCEGSYDLGLRKE